MHSFISIFNFLRSWLFVTFLNTNEVQHVPFVWFVKNSKMNQNQSTCWFPNMKSDFKKVSDTSAARTLFSGSQIAKMITISIPNGRDGSYYEASRTAGPFG